MDARTPYYAPEAACLWCEDCAPEDASPTIGGETDSPSHCDECGVLLDEDLTTDGLQYVEDALREHVASVLFTRADGGKLHGGAPDVLETWCEHWSLALDSRLVDAFQAVREHERQRVDVYLVDMDGGYGRKSGTDGSGAHWTELVSEPEDGMPSSCDVCGAAVYADGWLCLDGGEVVCSSHVYTPADAMASAAAWHGGQDSTLYALASTGYVSESAAWSARLERRALDVPERIRNNAKPGYPAARSRLPLAERQAARRELDALASWCEAVRGYGYAEAIGAIRTMLRSQDTDGTYLEADKLAEAIREVLRPYGLRL